MIAAAVVRQPYRPTIRIVVPLWDCRAVTLWQPQHISTKTSPFQKIVVFLQPISRWNHEALCLVLQLKTWETFKCYARESMMASRISVGCLLFLVTRFSQNPQLKNWYISATLLIIKCSSRRWRAQQNKNEDNLINRSAGFVRNGGVCTKGCHGQGWAWWK